MVVARPEDCTLCGVCVDACPRDALSLAETVVVDLAACNGCGACVTECPNDVLALERA